MPERPADIRAHVVVMGRVQGVWFRASAVEKARSLGVRGWVKNRRDGAVEAVFEGARKQVEQAVAWCYRGPDLAQVESVELAWSAPTGEYTAFSVAF